MQRIILLYISVIFIFVSCNDSNTCLTKYTKKSEFDKRLFISIDTTQEPNKDCSYFVKTDIPLTDSSYAESAMLYLFDNKFYMKLNDPVSKDFILFDMDLPSPQTYQIEINYLDTIMKLECRFENKLVTQDNLEVRIFRVKDLFCFYPDDFCSSLDVIFFVTKEHGVIGTYLTDIDSEGQEIMVAPAGDIFKEYIDYSQIEFRYLM